MKNKKINSRKKKINSRKKFLKILTAGALTIPYLSSLASANMYIRKDNGSTIDFNDLVSTSDIQTLVTGDHGTATTDQVVNVCYGTSATPPTASTTTEGCLYVQYTA